MQVFKAGFLELAEYLKVIATAGQDGAWAKQQLVEIAVRLDRRFFQQLARSSVPALLVDAVFLVPVHALHLVLLANIEYGLRRLVPGVDLADQQRDVQLFQRLAQVAQVA